MSTEFVPSGILAPLITPFTDRDTVDLGALESLANEMLDAGASALVALATTGEPHTLSADEQAAVVSTVASICGDRGAPLVVGVATNDTRAAIVRHEALADIPGAVASLAVVPYYIRPSETAIVRHFQALAARSPVPLILYNIPYRTGQGLCADALLELGGTDGIVGLKQAVGGIDVDTLRVLAEAPSGFVVLGGDDPFLFPLTLMGAAGAIAASAHICTKRFVQMIDDGLNGRVAEGREHAQALLPLVRALFAEPSPAVIKAVLHAQGKIATPHVRMPLASASSEAAAHALESAALLRA